MVLAPVAAVVTSVVLNEVGGGQWRTDADYFGIRPDDAARRDELTSAPWHFLADSVRTVWEETWNWLEGLWSVGPSVTDWPAIVLAIGGRALRGRRRCSATVTSRARPRTSGSGVWWCSCCSAGSCSCSRANYVYWTTPGNDVITGVQARYLEPLLVLIPVADRRRQRAVAARPATPPSPSPSSSCPASWSSASPSPSACTDRSASPPMNRRHQTRSYPGALTPVRAGGGAGGWRAEGRGHYDLRPWTSTSRSSAAAGTSGSRSGSRSPGCGLQVALYDVRPDAVELVNAGRCPSSSRARPRRSRAACAAGTIDATLDTDRRDAGRARHRGDRHPDRRAPQPRPRRGRPRHQRDRRAPRRRPAARAAQHRLPGRHRDGRAARSRGSASTSTSPSAPSASPRARRSTSSPSCPQIVAARTPRAVERATKLFRNLTARGRRTSSPRRPSSPSCSPTRGATSSSRPPTSCS